MNLIISLILGVLFSSSVFLMFQKSFFKLIVGVILFGYATIFFVFTIGGITKNEPPIVTEKVVDVRNTADPLPQALTLTAIVISIGVQLFVIVLLKKVYENVETEDLDKLNSTDRLD